MIDRPAAAHPADVKSCCAALYGSDIAAFLMGDSYHPGGAALTQRLGRLMDLSPGARVLDVASGKGTSAFLFAEMFECQVVGIDLSGAVIDAAKQTARDRGLAHRVQFMLGDADALPFPAESFDAILCECAFCIFPDKAHAAREFVRVLKPGGRFGMSDIVRAGALPPEFNDMMSWVACIADAHPVDRYCKHLLSAGLVEPHTENCDSALHEFVKHIRTRLLAAEVLSRLKHLNIAGFDFAAASRLGRIAQSAVDDGTLGYAMIVAAKAAA